MMWFSYNVLGWTNTQVIQASSMEEAIENAFSEAYGFTAISEEEAQEIRASW
jgi:hypothetical protein